MKLNTSNLEFSQNDVKRKIKLPNKLTEPLSYFIGIHVGDGNISCYKGCNYDISYSGHLIDEKEFHTYKLASLITNLFNINPYFSEDIKSTSIKTYFRSKLIFNFLTKIVGLPKGPKTNIKVPQLILNSNKKIKISFLRGLADTEFSLTFKKRYKLKHYYPSISYATPNKILIKQIYKMISELNIPFSLGLDYITKRKNKILMTNHLHLYGKTNLIKWMDQIGFDSSKHITKYKVWKKFGFCPAYTTIEQRKKMLDY